MRRSFLFLAFLVVSSLALAPQLHARRRHPVRRPAVPIAEIDAIAASALQRPLPGVAIAAGREGQIIHDAAYGFADIDAATPLWSGSIFQIGSVTKQFTAAAILRLAERGALAIDDEVTRWVPEFPTGGHTVRLRHLLNHTSGVPEYTSRLVNAYRPMTSSEIYALIAGRPYSFAPGSNWDYSNTGFYTLGLVIERASGRRYADFVREEFLLPLGLMSSSYCGEPPASPAPSGYLELSGVGVYGKVDAADMSLPYAAGALCSTASDLVRWNDALHHGRVLAPDSYAVMIAPTSLTDGRTVGYGFGLGVGRDRRGRRVINHGGSILGFVSALSYYPDDDVSVAVLVNLTSLLQGDIAATISDDVADVVMPR